MRRLKYFIYPIIVLLLVFGLSYFKINGSSVAMYNTRLSVHMGDDKNLLFGSPRAIRSDQWLAGIPIYVSQDINNEPNINEDIGDGIDMSTQNMPQSNILTMFRPASLVFFITNDTEFAYSFLWWFELATLLIGTYLLLLELTKKNLLISIFGSLLFLATPFIQWWNQPNMIAWISFGLFFFLRIIKERHWIKSILYGLGLSYSIVTYVLFLYPAFQIPLAYVALAIAIGVVIKDRKQILKNIKTILSVFICSVLIAIGFIFLFYEQASNVIEITMQTVYPGERFISAGGGSIDWLFDGFYNILLQRDSNTAPFGNQCESSNFFLLFPPIIIWVIYKNILLYIKRKKIDWIGLCVSFVLIFFTLWYLLPLPDVISKYTLFSNVLPQRLFIGFGYGSYLLMFYVLANKEIYKLKKRRWLDWVLCILLSVSFGYLMYVVGNNLYNISPDFFKSPSFIPTDMKIYAVVVLVVLLLIMLFVGWKRLFMFTIFMFGFGSTFYINPIYKGLDILINTDLAEYITELSSEDDSKWVIYGDNAFSQYALANGASIINGIHTYPQFGIWSVLDPDGEYMDVYNRFAHVSVSDYEDGEEFIRLTAMDALEVNIDPCDTKWNELDVKYILSTYEMDKECLTPLKVFDNYNVYIYLLDTQQEDI